MISFESISVALETFSDAAEMFSHALETFSNASEMFFHAAKTVSDATGKFPELNGTWLDSLVLAE